VYLIFFLILPKTKRVGCDLIPAGPLVISLLSQPWLIYQFHRSTWFRSWINRHLVLTIRFLDVLFCSLYLLFLRLISNFAQDVIYSFILFLFLILLFASRVHHFDQPAQKQIFLGSDNWRLSLYFQIVENHHYRMERNRDSVKCPMCSFFHFVKLLIFPYLILELLILIPVSYSLIYLEPPPILHIYFNIAPSAYSPPKSKIKTNQPFQFHPQATFENLQFLQH